MFKLAVLIFISVINLSAKVILPAAFILKCAPLEKKAVMEQNVEGLVTQITRAFSFGGLHEYLKNTPQPDIDIISEYLSAIEQGDDLYHRDEDAQVKAYALLQKIRMIKDGEQQFFSR